MITLLRHLSQWINALRQKQKILLAKIRLLKRLWSIVLRFLSVSKGRNNSIKMEMISSL